MVGQGLVTSAILFFFSFFNLVIMLAFLYRKKFADFFISLVLIVVIVLATNFIDKLLAPYKLNKLADHMSTIAEKANSSRSFGNVTPTHVCDPKADENGNRICKICYCPRSMDLEEVDGVPYCLFRASNGQYTDERFKAPCSNSKSFNEKPGDVTSLFDSEPTKTFALYKYRNNQLKSCEEYRVWDSWDTSIMKKVCEHNSVDRCIVQDKTGCSTLGAKITCQRKNTNTHRPLKMIAYSETHHNGFEKGECSDDETDKVFEDIPVR